MIIYKIKRNKLKLRKRHFQLLEVMVAILVLMLCAAPALEIFTRMYIAQERIVRINERDHLVRLIQAKIVERLYQNTISIDDFNDRKGQDFSFSDPELDRLITPLAYEPFYRLQRIKVHTKRNATAPDKYLIGLTISMKDKVKQKNYPLTDVAYAYVLYVNAGWKKNDNEEAEEQQEGNQKDKSGAAPFSEEGQSKAKKWSTTTPKQRSNRTKKQTDNDDDLF